MALEGLAGRLSCLGCALLYSTLAIGCSGTDAFAQAVKEAWRRLQETGFRVNGIDGFSLSLEAAQEGEPLSLAGSWRSCRRRLFIKCSCWRYLPLLTGIWTG